VVVAENGNGLDSISNQTKRTLLESKNFFLFHDHIAVADSTKGGSANKNTLVELIKDVNYDIVVIRPEVIRIVNQGSGNTTSTSMLNAFEMDSLRTKGNNSRANKLLKP